MLEPENGNMLMRSRLLTLNVKILKSESHAYRRRVVESFLTNQKTCSCNISNRNDGGNFPSVYSVLVSNK